MFSCSRASCHSNNKKIECMASWLILGGVIPLAVAAVVQGGSNITLDSMMAPGNASYLWVVAMGVASLLVKRAGALWRGIVMLGGLGLLITLSLSITHAIQGALSQADIANIIWSAAVFLLVSCQYCRDVNDSKQSADRGVAIVTGASSGIGSAAAKALQQAGYRVFGTSRKATGEIVDGITMLPCDVTDDASVKKLVEDVLRHAGRIDLLVNNAGMSLVAAAEESSAKQAQDLFNVNVFGVMRVASAVLPTMRAQGNGRIIHISSVVGFLPAPFHTLYTSTKHAVEGYSESLDHEVRTFGIRSILVEPAFTRTAIDQNVMKADQILPVYDAMRGNVEALLKKGINTGDAPEMVADTIVAAATDRLPKLRYTAGKSARILWLIRRVMPASFVDRSIRKFNGLPIIKTSRCCH